MLAPDVHLPAVSPPAISAPAISPLTCLLSVTELSIERGGFALFRPLSFQLHCGSVVMIAADNGVGKTSLLRTLAGLASAAEGEFQWHVAARELRFLGHQPGLKGALSLLDNLRFWLAQDQCGWDAAAVEAGLRRFNLRGHEEQPAAALSAGQRRRVALLRLQLSPGQCWLLDEPFANLDQHGIALVQELIATRLAQGGSVILTSHGQLPVPIAVLRVALVAV